MIFIVLVLYYDIFRSMGRKYQCLGNYYMTICGKKEGSLFSNDFVSRLVLSGKSKNNEVEF
jgi:hypothetical protein